MESKGERKGEGVNDQGLGTGVSNLDSRGLGQKHIQKIDLRQLSPRGRVGQMFKAGSKFRISVPIEAEAGIQM